MWIARPPSPAIALPAMSQATLQTAQDSWIQRPLLQGLINTTSTIPNFGTSGTLMALPLSLTLCVMRVPLTSGKLGINKPSSSLLKTAAHCLGWKLQSPTDRQNYADT